MSKLQRSENSTVNRCLTELHLGGWEGRDTKQTNENPKEIIQCACGNGGKGGAGHGICLRSGAFCVPGLRLSYAMCCYLAVTVDIRTVRTVHNCQLNETEFLLGHFLKK